MVKQKIIKQGFSLIEILIVVGLFAVLSLIATFAISFSLRGSSKSESIGNLRSEVNNALQIMSRQLRNASSIPACTGSQDDQIQFLDQSGTQNRFSCLSDINGGFIASSSADIRMTSSEVDITECFFVCTFASAGGTDSVLVNIKANNKQTIGVEETTLDLSTTIYLRNY